MLGLLKVLCRFRQKFITYNIKNKFVKRFQTLCLAEYGVTEKEKNAKQYSRG